MKTVRELETLIKYHKALYYQGNPEISDDEFDEIEEKLRVLDPENPALNLVGTAITGIDKVSHEKKMLSLEKKYNYEELITWIGDYDVVSLYKIDGVSCSLIYENGKLILAKTRGDGTVGENITEKAKWISDIPLLISEKNKIEIRGEMYCDEKDFFNLSIEMENLGLEKPKNQRNIVAGLIGRKDHVELNRHIKFMAFDMLIDKQLYKTEYKKLEGIETLGFEVPQYILHKKNKMLKEKIEETKSFMASGDYLIDGLVLTYNDLALHEELGATAHHPRYRLAFKFKGDSKNTIIEEITWSISRNGILTPVANVKPVDLGGAKIARVTLHNYGMVKQYGLKKGDEIEIIRSGEVIPKFVSLVKESKGKQHIPKKCPSCDGDIDIVDIRLICMNDRCPGKLKESILNYIQKIGIDDLSSKRLNEMIKKGLVSKIEDLYSLTLDTLLTLDKTKETLANKLLLTIEKSKEVDLVVFLSALGIQGGAFNKCEKVVMGGYNTIEKIMSLKESDLQELDGFAERSASEFIRSLEEKKGLIKNLQKIGINILSREKVDNFNSAIAGKNICITGSLSRKRSDIESIIRDQGGKTVSSVSKNTDYLLTNDTTSTSSKFKKANSLGVPIITEEDFFKIL